MSHSYNKMRKRKFYDIQVQQASSGFRLDPVNQDSAKIILREIPRTGYWTEKQIEEFDKYNTMLHESRMQMIIDFANGEKRYAAFTGGKVPLGYDEFVLWMRAGGEDEWWHSPTFLCLLQVNGRTHFD